MGREASFYATVDGVQFSPIWSSGDSCLPQRSHCQHLLIIAYDHRICAHKQFPGGTDQPRDHARTNRSYSVIHYALFPIVRHVLETLAVLTVFEHVSKLTVLFSLSLVLNILNKNLTKRSKFASWERRIQWLCWNSHSCFLLLCFGRPGSEAIIVKQTSYIGI